MKLGDNRLFCSLEERNFRKRGRVIGSFYRRVLGVRGFRGRRY